MTLVHSKGIHVLDVGFCACLDPDTHAAVDDMYQLVPHGFWPASWKAPDTAFTMEVLKEFNEWSQVSQVSGYDMWRRLMLKTDSVLSDEVPVSQ